MAETKVLVENVETNIALEKAKGFWANYSKPIIYVGGAIIVLALAWFGYTKFYKEPNIKNASEAIFPAEKLFGKTSVNSSFNKDTLNLILKGDKTLGITGMLDIIKKYGGTPAGNRANYFAGACYLQQKDFANAVKYLNEFDGNGAYQIESKANLMLGYAYSEQKKTDDALSHFKKAASVAGNDEGMAAEALFIAGRYADATGKTKDAIELFTQLKDKFPASSRVNSGDADKYLAKLGVVK
jgi:TolA-binding protein